MKNELKIIRVPIHTPTILPHTTTNCYLIGNEQECLLVDAGYDLPETKQLLEKAIAENKLAVPKSIVLTHSHPDHAPGVRQLMDWSPTVYCHKEEEQTTREAISPWSKVFFLNDGDCLTIGSNSITILHVPGHTSGHLNLYIPSEKILVAGDNIVAEGTSWIGPPDGDMGDYLQTLSRLKLLELKRIGPGHGGWVENTYEHINFVINRRLHRENQIKSLLLANKMLSSEDLTRMIYEELPHPSVFEFAKRTTEAHLMKLMKEGSVILKDTLYSVV